MLAPDLGYVSHTGERGALRSLYADGPLAMVFLRHLGCVFCREQVAMLHDYQASRLVFVVMASPKETAQFRQEMNSPHTFLCDEAQELYRAFGLKRGGVGQMFNLKTFKRGMEATRAGHRVGRPVGDPWVLGGAFLVSQGGEVTFRKPAHDASENVTASELAMVIPVRELL